jgi:hypothetical protein
MRGWIMSNKNLDHIPPGAKSTQPIVGSYDTGYEHSLQHYAAVRKIVEEAEMNSGTRFADYSNDGVGDHDGIGDHALHKDPAA